MAKNGETKKGRSASTTWQQKAAMVNWLEAPGGKNFRWINGSAQNDLSSVVNHGREIILPACLQAEACCLQRCRQQAS